MIDLVAEKFSSYPAQVEELAIRMKGLLYEVAAKEKIEPIEESLKWGEPCFKAPDGSPVRMDWKDSSPDKFYIFFICSTKLIATFKELYRDIFVFEGNRAIILEISDEQPTIAIKHCFSLALKYHKVKIYHY